MVTGIDGVIYLLRPDNRMNIYSQFTAVNYFKGAVNFLKVAIKLFADLKSVYYKNKQCL